MANAPVPITTRSAATSIADADLFGMYVGGIWKKLTGAVMRDQIQNRLTSLGNFASGGSIGACDAWDTANIAQTTTWKELTIDAPTNTLSQQKCIRNTGSAGFYMYGRYIRPGGAHVFTYVPSVGWRRTASGPQRIFQTGVNITMPADTNTNAVFTFTIPGGFIGANGTVVVDYNFTATNNANAKTIALVADDGGAVTMATGNSANTGAPRGTIKITNSNSVSAQQCSNQFQVTGPSFATLTTALNTAVDTVWTFSVTKATAGDSVVFLNATVDIIRFD